MFLNVQMMHPVGTEVRKRIYMSLLFRNEFLDVHLLINSYRKRCKINTSFNVSG